MKTNLWIYANNVEQQKTAKDLLSFGAEVFKRAKAIKDINLLKSIKQNLDNNTIHPMNSNIDEFIYEYLIDCIRFLIFFENYMKAELIIKGYCVHIIKRDYPGYKELAKAQYSRPIELREINEIENFFIDQNNNIISHSAIIDNTIGMKYLIASNKYYSNYDFEPSMLSIISKFNDYRNKLHFHESIEIQLSEEFISRLEIMNDFIDRIIRERISPN